METYHDNLIEALPEPEVIRDRLTVLVRETQTLRRLLRVTERAKAVAGHVHQEKQSEVGHDH